MNHFTMLKKFRSIALCAAIVGMLTLAGIDFFSSHYTKLGSFTYGSIFCGLIFVVFAFTSDFDEDNRADDALFGAGAILFSAIGLVLAFFLVAKTSVSPWIIPLMISTVCPLTLRILLLIDFVFWVKSFKPETRVRQH